MRPNPWDFFSRSPWTRPSAGRSFAGRKRLRTGAWEIVGFLHEGLPGQEQLQEILWGLARRILKDLMTDYRGPEILVQLLENPGAFLRTLLFMFYGGLPEESTAGWDPPRFH